MSDWLSSHRFWLRPDCVVCLSIPEDFTAQDAKKLQEWVQTLPKAEHTMHRESKFSEVGLKLPNPAGVAGPGARV